MEKYLPLLRKVTIFENISDEDIPKMLSCLGGIKRSYKKDEFICLSGDAADFIGIILEGNVQVVQDSFDGKRNIISALGPGEIFGEAFSCANSKTIPVDILAISDCEILFLKRERFLYSCSNHCEFHNQMILNLLRVVASKNVMLNQKLQIISKGSTAEKVMAFLSEQSKKAGSNEFTIPYDRQALADYLGVERSAMSAEISKLQKDGVLETNRSYFKLL